MVPKEYGFSCSVAQKGKAIEKIKYNFVVQSRQGICLLTHILTTKQPFYFYASMLNLCTFLVSCSLTQSRILLAQKILLNTEYIV